MGEKKFGWGKSTGEIFPGEGNEGIFGWWEGDSAHPPSREIPETTDTFNVINLKHYIPNIKFLEWNPADISLPWGMQQKIAPTLHRTKAIEGKD